MTRELLQQALDALEYYDDADDVPTTASAVINLIRAHLDQSQGEPVAWMHSKTGRVSESPYDLSLADDDETAVPLYEHPAHTEAEVQEIMDMVPAMYEIEETVRRILGVGGKP